MGGGDLDTKKLLEEIARTQKHNEGVHAQAKKAREQVIEERKQLTVNATKLQQAEKEFQEIAGKIKSEVVALNEYKDELAERAGELKQQDADLKERELRLSRDRKTEDSRINAITQRLKEREKTVMVRERLCIERENRLKKAVEIIKDARQQVAELAI